jgi:amidohydrolase
VDYKERVSREIHSSAGRIIELARQIGENPELGFAEYEASALLTQTLEQAGYTIEKPLAGLETAFRATLGVGKPNIALLCEYDALPGIGHGCGHNLIGAASVGAALGLARILEEIGGQVTVIGAPGEETGGGKTILVEQGIFHGVDGAMMFHPSSENLLMSTTNALDAYEFTFIGRPAHAAGSPEHGINALDGVIQLFNGMNALREHLKDTVRIHGIITEGGQAPNIVPDRAVAQFYFRAPHRSELDAVTSKIFDVARGAALMTGAEVSWRKFEHSNDNMIPNRMMAAAFGANLEALGVTDIEEFQEGKGSSDMGNVSHVVPAIHPYLSIGHALIGHTAEFAEACLNPAAFRITVLAAEALAHTTIDLLTDSALLMAVRSEHAGL